MLLLRVPGARLVQVWFDGNERHRVLTLRDGLVCSKTRRSA